MVQWLIGSMNFNFSIKLFESLNQNSIKPCLIYSFFSRQTEGTTFYGCYRKREIIFLFFKSYQRTLNRTHTTKQTVSWSWTFSTRVAISLKDNKHNSLCLAKNHAPWTSVPRSSQFVFRNSLRPRTNIRAYFRAIKRLLFLYFCVTKITWLSLKGRSLNVLRAIQRHSSWSAFTENLKDIILHLLLEIGGPECIFLDVLLQWYFTLWNIQHAASSAHWKPRIVNDCEGSYYFKIILCAAARVRRLNMGR